MLIMSVEEAREYASKRMKELSPTNPEEKLKAVNTVIAELRDRFKFFVTCPVTGSPLYAVKVAQGPVICYHTLSF